MKKHIYWDSQPVDRCKILKSCDKIINKKDIKSAFIIDKNYYVIKFASNDYPSIDILNFIIDNYSHKEPYDINKIKWLISYNKTIIVVLYKNTSSNIYNIRNKPSQSNDIILGTIMGKITTLMINHKETKVLNVEMLCIKKSERNKRIAPLLIDKMVNIYKHLDVEFPIFTIDDAPLPFNYFSKVTYYHLLTNHVKRYKNIKRIKFKKIINIYDIKRIYRFILVLLSKYKIYEIIKEDKLHLYIDNINCHLYSDFNEKSFIIYTYNLYVNKNTGIKMKAVVIHIIESYIYDKLTLIYNFSNYIKSKCDIITCLNISNNDTAFNKLGFIKGVDTYYHVYNYSLDYINAIDNALSFA